MNTCSKEHCKKKLPLIYYPCKCKKNFCETHKYPEDHSCSYDYFKENQKNMINNLSSIVFTKKELLLKTL